MQSAKAAECISVMGPGSMKFFTRIALVVAGILCCALGASANAQVNVTQEHNTLARWGLR
jgi:hypothetical protein